MNQQTLQHGCTAGRHLWLCMAVALGLVLGTQATPAATGLRAAPAATGPRDRLTATELLAPAEMGTSPVHNAYFLPVGQATPALHPFKGTVAVQASTLLRRP